MKDRVSITVENGIADVKLIRTDKMNALDEQMFDAIIEAGETVSKDANIRCVVLSGDGKAFCAGIDVSNFASMSMGQSEFTEGGRTLATRTHGHSNKFQYVVSVWRDCPVPVIAAVHGVAIGGGCQLALGADIRLVHPDTRMSIMEMKWGLIPDMAGISMARELASVDVLRELTYTARIFSGEEAVKYGLATRTTRSPYEDAMALAREISLKNPTAIQAAKSYFNTIDDLSFEENLLNESKLQDNILSKHNQVEAVRAELEKRTPNFKDHR